ncbi:MAG TPA: dihydrolipoamide acetyltransferase family protein [Phycisphaerales bacterium]|nr:dihydrolipoamide acetyltransferase family protein [Phycisphaerales bacterium]
MPISVTMPRLSDTMQQGTIVKWNVKEGQKVKSGDVIADIETDKATMELPTYEDGTIARLAVPEGQTVPVGTLIVLMAAPGEDVAAAAKGGAAPTASTASTSAAKDAPSTTNNAPLPGKSAKVEGETGASRPAQASSIATVERAASTNGSHAHAATGAANERIFVSPLARKIAAESGLDLNNVQGTGPSGRIIRKDVEAAIAGGPAVRKGSPAPAAAPRPSPLPPIESRLAGKMVPVSNMRRTIARRLVESKTTVPHYQVTVEVDMEPLVALRASLNEQLAAQGVKLSVNDFLVRACALAMHQHPYVNSRWVEKGSDAAIELLAEVNVGVAIALDESRGGGLVVATIRSADQIGLRQISSQSKQLAEKARAKGLTIEEMSDSTFTISNLGMFGVDHFTAIINPPNVAILAVGAALQKPVVRNGQLAVGTVMSMTMSSDHRVVDGAMAAAYLNTVKNLLEKPATLLV